MTGATGDDPLTDQDAAMAVKVWQEGRTGYPLVDAGMRQLLAEVESNARALRVCYFTTTAADLDRGPHPGVGFNLVLIHA